MTSATGFAGSLALPSAAVVALALAGCAGAAADPSPVDAAAPAIVDAGDAGADAAADAGTFVAMYGAPGCDVAPSPRGGLGAALAITSLGAVVARERRRRRRRD